jgi:imidazolonepropionase-like amidohydrolase
VKALIDAMVSHHIALDPTLAIQQIGERSRSTFSLEEYSVARQSYDRMARFVKRAFDAGVPILAGTDDDNLFDELDAYAAAGIPPADVIRTATVNGAKWLGHADEFGTIEPGKRANLVLVDGDPLRNISDMRKITTVVQDGRVVVRR